MFEPIVPPTPEEEGRQRALDAQALLDTPREAAFDALVRIAAEVLDVPVAMLTLVDRARVWTKASTGVDRIELPRANALCDVTVANGDVVEISDLLSEPQFADRMGLTEHHQIRFYIGAPVTAAIDHDVEPRVIGTLCGIDHQPRTLTARQQEQLRELAVIAGTLIAARTSAHQAMTLAESASAGAQALRRQERTFHQAERLAMIGSWRYSIVDNTVVWSEGVYRIHELDPGSPLTVETALDYYPPHARAVVSDALARTIETGESFNFEVDFVTARQRPLRVRCIGEVELEKGRPVAVTGLIQDITERYMMEQSFRRSAAVDEVTRIGNRAAFNRELENAMARARLGEAPLTLVLIDLDGFKAINDTHGHLTGDDVLRAVGRRLRAPYLADSFAARLGGDEFALIVTDPAICADPAPTIERLTGDLKLPVHTGQGAIGMSGTLGYSEFSPLVTSTREFIRRADAALYEAKRLERGTARSYSGLLFRPGVATRAA